jgi:hypothetical protein
VLGKGVSLKTENEENRIFDDLAKSQKPLFSVIPVKTGIQEIQSLLDSRPPTATFGGRLRGSDDF